MARTRDLDGNYITIPTTSELGTLQLGGIDDVPGLEDALNDKLESPIAIADVTDLQDELDGKLGDPAAIADVTGLQAALDLKANIAQGTSFPGSPETDDPYYRTDRRLDYFYNGTMWLSRQLFSKNLHTTGVASVSATTTSAGAPVDGEGYSIYVERFVCNMYSSSLSGSAYWQAILRKLTPPEVATDLATVDDISGTNSEWLRKSATVNAVVDPSTHPNLALRLVKTSTPGVLYAVASYTYRLVG